ncbi:MAG: FHA domain-containing protein [Terriglobales bacterium]|jgi:pSer/pThr/pTyr-binding forkhead associated (FHA) protein
MNKILIRHLTGSRANQVDQFPAGTNEVIFGREPGVTVQYDADNDDLVSRRHVKINCDSSGSWQICDLQSRNGAFLNKQRIFGSAVRLSHNDVVQLGAGGPEFRFELDPPPASFAKATRFIPAGAMTGPGETREIAVPGAAAMSRPVGRATVERMLDENFGKVKKQSTKFLQAALVAAVIVLVAGLFFYLRLNKGAEQNARLVQQQQQLLEQMDQQLKRQPDQITQLSAELKKSEEQNSKNLNAISKALANHSTSSPSGASQSASNTAFEEQLKTVLAAVKTNPEQALQGASDLVSQYPNNWESYGAAGAVLVSQKHLPEAKVAYQQALGLAPEEVKPKLTAAIQQIDAQSGAVAQ